MSTFMDVYQELVERDRQRDARLAEAERRLEEAERSAEEAANSKVLELQQRRQQERRATLESLLKARFGELDDSLLALVQRLVELPDEAYALPQAFSLSRQVLLAQFSRSVAGT